MPIDKVAYMRHFSATQNPGTNYTRYSEQYEAVSRLRSSWAAKPELRLGQFIVDSISHHLQQNGWPCDVETVQRTLFYMSDAHLVKICESFAREYELHPVHMYDPEFGDTKMCRCGHLYHRHFDSYSNMEAVGCKYCPCKTWTPPDLDKS